MVEPIAFQLPLLAGRRVGCEPLECHALERAVRTACASTRAVQCTAHATSQDAFGVPRLQRALRARLVLRRGRGSCAQRTLHRPVDAFEWVASRSLPPVACAVRTACVWWRAGGGHSARYIAGCIRNAMLQKSAARTACASTRADRVHSARYIAGRIRSATFLYRRCAHGLCFDAGGGIVRTAHAISQDAFEVPRSCRGALRARLVLRRGADSWAQRTLHRRRHSECHALAARCAHGLCFDAGRGSCAQRTLHRRTHSECHALVAALRARLVLRRGARS